MSSYYRKFIIEKQILFQGDLPKKLSDDSNDQSSWCKIIAVGCVVAATAGLFLFSTIMK